MALFSAANATRLCSSRLLVPAWSAHPHAAFRTTANERSSSARPMLSQPITVKLDPPRTGAGSEKGMLASTHWTIERVLALSMLPLYPVALMTDIPAMDWAVAAAVTLHGYW